jgi:hypothetical protein
VLGPASATEDSPGFLSSGAVVLMLNSNTPGAAATVLLSTNSTAAPMPEAELLLLTDRPTAALLLAPAGPAMRVRKVTQSLYSSTARSPTTPARPAAARAPCVLLWQLCCSCFTLDSSHVRSAGLLLLSVPCCSNLLCSFGVSNSLPLPLLATRFDCCPDVNDRVNAMITSHASLGPISPVLEAPGPDASHL